MSESILARIQFIVRTPDGIPADVDRRRARGAPGRGRALLDRRLCDALIDAHGEEEGNRLFAAYGEAIPVGYQEQVPARAAVPDIDRIDQLANGETELAMSLYRPLEQGGGLLRLKLGAPATPSPCPTSCRCSRTWACASSTSSPTSSSPRAAGASGCTTSASSRSRPVSSTPTQVGSAFQDAFARVWRGEAENDGFNQLVLRGLDWRQIVVLRTYCKYLLQIGIPFSQAYMEQTLARNPALARQAAQLFEASFDPDSRATARRGSPSSRPRSAPAWTRSPTSTRTASCGATCA